MRGNPDELLKVVQDQEERQSHGRLKIFFGYAAGVGKTYAMLKAAHAAQRRGIDVVAGYIEPHSRPQTAALLTGLEVLPVCTVDYHGLALSEFDLQGALDRKPQLILVDELAHTDAAESRHKKRYQDVQELLRAGIDVYTTVNVQHIESLNDLVASITGIAVQERIPDSVFDDADQVELIDIEPRDLIERLREGNVYKAGQAEQAMGHFFTIENLTALREIALRRCADRVNDLSSRIRIQNQGGYYTDEHILVCLSSSPTNPKIIRTGARMAKAFRGAFTALFVETPDFPSMSEENKKRLQANTRLARQMGASVETVSGEDVARQIAEFSRLSGVSKIVIGRYNLKHHWFWHKPTLTDRLIEYAPNLDIYIIPDKSAASTGMGRSTKRCQRAEPFMISDVLKSILILTGATLIGVLFDTLGLKETNTITVYILGVLLTAVTTSRRWYSFMYAAASVLLFNFFFTEPRFTLDAYAPEYPITFFVMFLAALITGNLTMRIKEQGHKAAQTAYGTKVLLETNQLLQQADSKQAILATTAQQLLRLLERDIVVYGEEEGKLQEPTIFYWGNDDGREQYLSDNERAVAAWVLKNGKQAGAGTDTLSSAKCLYLAVRIHQKVYGVVGIVMGTEPFDVPEHTMMLSILGECALAMESRQAAIEKEEAAVLAKNEQLRANLLRMISHDLRTPLTAISGNAGILLANGADMVPEKRIALYRDIYDNSLWLINVMENLLAVTKLEKGTLHMQLRPELMDEVLAEAMEHISYKKKDHHIAMELPQELALVRADGRLIMQVIINMVNNAIVYTQAGSHITLSLAVRHKQVIVEISDDGPGLSDEAKDHIFDQFYTGQGKTTDNRRGLGLGLSLCKSIIEAHGGTISVRDNQPCGVVFQFILPEEEVTLHE